MKNRIPSENYQKFRRIVRVAGLIFLIICCIVSLISGYKIFDVSIRDEILHNILFKTGINLFGLIIAIVLYYSCLRVSYKDENNNSITSFLLMIFYNGMLFVTAAITGYASPDAKNNENERYTAERLETDTSRTTMIITGSFCQPRINKEEGTYEEKIIGNCHGGGNGAIPWRMQLQQWQQFKQ